MAAIGGILAASRLLAVNQASGGSDLLLFAIAGPYPTTGTEGQPRVGGSGAERGLSVAGPASATLSHA